MVGRSTSKIRYNNYIVFKSCVYLAWITTIIDQKSKNENSAKHFSFLHYTSSKHIIILHYSINFNLRNYKACAVCRPSGLHPSLRDCNASRAHSLLTVCYAHEENSCCTLPCTTHAQAIPSVPRLTRDALLSKPTSNRNRYGPRTQEKATIVDHARQQEGSWTHTNFGRTHSTMYHCLNYLFILFSNG
jgi:hypothetical protein